MYVHCIESILPTPLKYYFILNLLTKHLHHAISNNIFPAAPESAEDAKEQAKKLLKSGVMYELLLY